MTSDRTGIGNNVVSVTVANDVCCGCGICAGVCPQDNLEMHWSAQGELVPLKKNTCAPHCRVCLSVCPFSGVGKNQDEIATQRFHDTMGVRFCEEAGYYGTSYVGFSLLNNHRLRGASGGMATWFLETLLEKKLVDAVVCATANQEKESDRLFTFGILSEPAAVRDAAGSKYYPIELSRIVKEIISDRSGKRYAVIGLPCLILGLHRAMDILSVLRERIVTTASLVCGQLPNRFYTEFISVESGVPVKSLRSASYRIKEGTRDAGNFLFRASASDGSTGKDMPWRPLLNHLWQNGYFVQNACNFCDDVFGETADIVFMDAWLPAYATEARGHSLIITRTSQGRHILEMGREDGSCALEEIPISDVVSSQRGTLWKKRHLIKGRIFRAERLHRKVPIKRVGPDAKVYFSNLPRILLHERIVAESKRLWPLHRDDQDSRGFRERMARWDRCSNLLELTSLTGRKTRNLIKDPLGTSYRILQRLLTHKQTL